MCDQTIDGRLTRVPIGVPCGEYHVGRGHGPNEAVARGIVGTVMLPHQDIPIYGDTARAIDHDSLGVLAACIRAVVLAPHRIAGEQHRVAAIFDAHDDAQGVVHMTAMKRIFVAAADLAPIAPACNEGHVRLAETKAMAG